MVKSAFLIASAAATAFVISTAWGRGESNPKPHDNVVHCVTEDKSRNRNESEPVTKACSKSSPASSDKPTENPKSK